MSTKIEGRTTDGRYTKPVDKVDKGSMSSNRVPLPVKKNFKPTSLPEDPMPKQLIRQAFAKHLTKNTI